MLIANIGPSLSCGLTIKEKHIQNIILNETIKTNPKYILLGAPQWLIFLNEIFSLYAMVGFLSFIFTVFFLPESIKSTTNVFRGII